MKRVLLCVASLLFLAGPALCQQPVSFKVTKKNIDIMIGKELFTRYHIGDVPKPMFWPLNAPGQIPLTRNYPMKKVKGETTDHPHQASAWFCHGDVIPEGIQVKAKIRGIDGVDFWSVAPGHGKIVCVQVGEPKLSKDGGTITTKNEWRTSDGVKILDETRTISVRDYGKARLIALHIVLRASVVPIVFGDTKEGSMGIRIADAINEKNGGVLQNSKGMKTEKKVWGHVADWCDYSGVLEGKKVGLAVFADPNNPHPSCWHARGYGLLAANPFGRAKARFPGVKGQTDLVRLNKGESISFRFGLLAHEGDASSGDVAAYFQNFVKLADKK